MPKGALPKALAATFQSPYRSQVRSLPAPFISSFAARAPRRLGEDEGGNRNGIHAECKEHVKQ